LEVNCCDTKFVGNATNNQLKFEFTAKPEKFNSLEKHVEIKHETVYKPEEDLFENTSTVKWGAPQFGPLRVWLNSGFMWTNFGKR